MRILRLTLAACLIPGAAAAQAGFLPGGREILSVSFAQGLPASVSLASGNAEVVAKDGTRMLRAASPTELLLQLPEVLPKDFTLEIELVPKACCNPHDLSVEGTARINQGPASAHILWDSDGSLSVIGGGEAYTTEMPVDLKASLPGSLTMVAISVQDEAIKLYTNGRRLFTLQERRFSRGRVLRVFLGGQDAAEHAVHLSRIRVATGPPVTVIATAAAPAPAPVVAVAEPAPVVAAPVAAEAGIPESRIAPAVTDSAAAVTEVPLERERPPDSIAVMPPAEPAPTPAVAAIQVGTGISDITGPIAEVGMMGYGKFGQVAGGLHTRLYARAFVFADQPGGRRVAFVSAELGQLFSSIKTAVMTRLAALYGSRYDATNVMISATHTHSGPGGYSHHVMYNLTTYGHIAQNYAAIVDGITEAIARADSTLAPATVSVMRGEVAERTMVNRSMAAFRLNPEAIAAGAARADSINRAITVVQVRRDGRPVGVIAWHAVHNTNMPNSNVLVSSDHKGYAAYLFEKQYGTVAPFRNPGGFVAAFPNGAEGDMSPNLVTCLTCEPPSFWGEGANAIEATAIIGRREFDAAHSLFSVAGQTPVEGVIDYRHSYVFMPAYVVTNTTHTNGVGGRNLCPAAYGASFMAGAEDGPSGPLGEGLALGTTMNLTGLDAARMTLVATVGAVMPALAPLVADVMLRSADSDRCQFPKPVLIPTGHLPNWTPEILPFQLLRIGPVAIAGVPGEMTVQGGRRLEAALRAALLPLGVTEVILTGLANEYSGYITTPEEYASQQYEGASTLYGRLTFDAYKEIFTGLGTAMALNQPATSGLPAPDLGLLPQIELQTSVIMDAVPGSSAFGKVLIQPPDRVARGSEVHITYQAGHPKNDLRRNNSYFRVERDPGAEPWDLVAWDAMPETRLAWGRDPTCPMDPCPWSTMGITWRVPADALPGQYRIRFVGSWKDEAGALHRYQGATNTFTVE